MAKKAPSTKEDVLALALDEINAKYGNGSIMVMGEKHLEDVPSIPTGIATLDRILGIGGLPKGRIVELFGPEGSGKTTVALHYSAEVQKSGGTVAFIDAEHALSVKLAKAIGIDISKLILSQPDTAEQALDIVRKLVLSGAVDAIIVDSVAALTPKSELEGNIGDTQVGAQARLMSASLRQLQTHASNMGATVVFINQLRSKISTGYSQGPQETTTGGRALKFYSSVRIEVKRGRSLTRGDETFGHELFLKVVKNKLASPFKSCKESLVYGKGIPVWFSIVNMAIDSGVMKKKGSWLVFKGETIGQGVEKVAEYLRLHPDLAEEIKKAAFAVEAEDDFSDTAGTEEAESSDEAEADVDTLSPEDGIPLELEEEDGEEKESA